MLNEAVLASWILWEQLSKPSYVRLWDIVLDEHRQVYEAIARDRDAGACPPGRCAITCTMAGLASWAIFPSGGHQTTARCHPLSISASPMRTLGTTRLGSIANATDPFGRALVKVLSCVEVRSSRLPS